MRKRGRREKQKSYFKMITFNLKNVIGLRSSFTKNLSLFLQKTKKHHHNKKTNSPSAADPRTPTRMLGQSFLDRDQSLRQPKECSGAASDASAALAAAEAEATEAAEAEATEVAEEAASAVDSSTAAAAEEEDATTATPAGLDTGEATGEAEAEAEPEAAETPLFPLQLPLPSPASSCSLTSAE